MSNREVEGSLHKEFLDLLHSQQGHFRLESGHHGNVWLDLDRLFLHPKRLQKFVLELARKISVVEFDAICGPMVGGALIAQSIAVELGVEFFYTERIVSQDTEVLYSTTYQIQKHLRKLVSGKRIAIVDDVINAGSAVRGTLSGLQSLNAQPVIIGALLVLGRTGLDYFDERTIPVRSISNLPNEIWKPEECPLCESRIPLTLFD